MQITADSVSDVVDSSVEAVTDRLTGSGDDNDDQSLETLCQVWRQSSTDPVPHICSNTILHLDTSHGRSLWEPVSQLSRISGSELNSFYSDRNIAITATLFFIFTILLSVACYLAVKYRLKSGSPSTHEYELESLTSDGKKIGSSSIVQDSPPPEYHAVVMNDDDDDDAHLPDYYDDV